MKQVNRGRYILTVEQWMEFAMKILGKPPKLRKRTMDRLVLT